jgi:hypothetical protein
LKARKPFVIACCAALIFAVSAAANSAPRDGASSRVTIQSWPHGVFGYVTKPTSRRCADHRRVAVFKQRGKGHHPRRDKRIATVRAQRSHGLFQWSARTHKAGKLYAKARRKRGCHTAFSKTIHFRPETGGGQGDGAGDFPTCSPYVSEGATTICKFDAMHFGVGLQGRCPGFGADQGSCDGTTHDGPYPWGVLPDGGEPRCALDWDWSKHDVLYVAFKPGQAAGYAHLGGKMPGPSSANFTVTDGYAQNDEGYGHGDHFYTPDLPGQGPGEVGGPLYLDFEHVGGHSNDAASVTIHGYLYLKE